ncbi:MAG: hypothetical protein SVV03_04610 [Candidatus Nanohaloarchaea archaeon]|nr:hypothetical protein [Candidatus Nanohaloarchaea archaeon]
MKTTVYELIQKRQNLIKQLAELREEREDEAVEKVRIGDEENVSRMDLQSYTEEAEELIEELLQITVALRRKNVDSEIEELGLTPEEARIRRDMLDKEIKSLRSLKDTEERSLYRDSGDVVKVSRFDKEELKSLVKKLTEERGKLDAALQRFNLTEEIEI